MSFYFAFFTDPVNNAMNVVLCGIKIACFTGHRIAEITINFIRNLIVVPAFDKDALLYLSTLNYEVCNCRRQ
jgi:hypothetical protein